MKSMIEALAECGLSVEIRFRQGDNFGSKDPDDWCAVAKSTVEGVGHSGSGATPERAVIEVLRSRRIALGIRADDLRKEADRWEAEAKKLETAQVCGELRAGFAEHLEQSKVSKVPEGSDGKIVGGWDNRTKPVSIEKEPGDVSQFAETLNIPSGVTVNVNLGDRKGNAVY